MKITFLGTGTSTGVPMIGCHCEVCTSHNPHDKRLRSSVLIEASGKKILIDAGPDFRQQMLKHNVEQLDAIVITHGHKDHIAGLDDVRAYNYWQKKPMPVYADAATQEQIKREMWYAFAEVKYPGIPDIGLIEIFEDKNFQVEEIDFIPIRVRHLKMPVLGFRVGDFTYITDANFIPADSFEKISGSKILVLNALRKEKHVSHFTLAEAIEIAQLIKPEHTYFTHISHQLGKHSDIQKELPSGIFLAHDSLEISI